MDASGYWWRRNAGGDENSNDSRLPVNPPIACNAMACQIAGRIQAGDS
jgi:hypothetical protein